MPDLQLVSTILKRWGIHRFEILPHEFVPGSPGRAMGRVVIDDYRESPAQP